MRGLTLVGDGEVEIRELPRPGAPGAGEVVVQVAVVGVCGSDLHMWQNTHSWITTPPVVLGHEAAGIIAEVGPGVTGWSVGDRVVSETAARVCGQCLLCRTGRYNLCPSREGYGATIDGAFSEYITVPTRILHRIPDSLPMAHAALTEPFAVAFNALVERAQVTPGDVVVVQGVGAIGSFCVQIARLRGAAKVIALGTPIDSTRLAAALEHGADHAVDITKDSALDLVHSLTGGLGADVVVDATGVSVALRDALELVRPGGQIVKVGWGPQPLNFNLDPLVQKAVTLHGSFSHTWNSWERVLRLMADGRLDPGSAIGGVYPLDAWEQAFHDMHSGKNIKSVVALHEDGPDA